MVGEVSPLGCGRSDPEEVKTVPSPSYIFLKHPGVQNLGAGPVPLPPPLWVRPLTGPSEMSA